MKVTALGVHGAFSTGKHSNVIDVGDLTRLLQELKNPNSEVEEIIRRYVRRAYYPTWQSNFLIELPQLDGKILRIVIDFGGDVRHALQNIGLTINDIDIWYCSHPHQDHIGGIEGVALSTFFNPGFRKEKLAFLEGKPISMVVDTKPLPDNCKPVLMAHEDVLKDVWPAARPGLETLEGIENVSLETYFKVAPLTKDSAIEFKDGDRIWIMKPIRSLHVVNDRDFMNSWGLTFEEKGGTHRIYFPTDSQFMSPKQIRTTYNKSTVIYQDCETSPFPSDVHAHINDLRTLPADIKKKMLLYHYQEMPTVGEHIDEGEFGGVLKMSDVQEY